MKKVSLILLLFIFIGFASFCDSNQKKEISSPELNYKRLSNKAKEALTYCKAKEYNTTYCVLIDMSMHSGKKRAFFWDFTKGTIIASGLCAHGCGALPWGETNTKEKPVFSNTPDSHCSSIGKYQIGQRGYSQWGININYLLQGLESTNNNALKRQIVLHSWDDVDDEEVYPDGTPEGWGCPAVGNVFMKTLDEKLKAEKKSVLLWMFN